MITNKDISIIEALLFIRGDKGLDLLELQNTLNNQKPSEIKKSILDLHLKYQNDPQSCFAIQFYGKDKYRLHTKVELYDYLILDEQINKRNKITKTCLEVLSLIFYKGPISKNSVEKYKNSDCSYQFQKLKELRLIKAIGKCPINNRSSIYTITDNFYKIFNLKKENTSNIIDTSEIETEINNKINDFNNKSDTDLLFHNQETNIETGGE